MSEDPLRLRPMTAGDRSEVAELIYVSLNVWHQTHGRPPLVSGGPKMTEVFEDVYRALDPDCALVAENPRTGRLAGSCFYHPRPKHVSLGIMNVHPNYFGQGVGRLLLKRVLEIADGSAASTVRLVSSALNLDSFSLYTRAGFVPRSAYQDMYVKVPAGGLAGALSGMERVREATLRDVEAMAALETELSGLDRSKDYRYCVENALGIWHASVCEDGRGRIEGFVISSSHPALNMLGPLVARSEAGAAALVRCELNRYPGRTPLFLAPAERGGLVRQFYEWGARNCELHLYQARGRFTPFEGIHMPTFLPESG